MPSPFPGMDPYLEDPAVWVHFHNSLADHIQADLNRRMPKGYFAQMETRNDVGLVSDGRTVVRLPDVAVEKTRRPKRESGEGGTAVAVLAEADIELSPHVEFFVDGDPAELASVQIRDHRRDNEVVTLIEILSPSNKRRGPDREAYLAKRAEILASTVTLVEVDLLRHGTRPVDDPQSGAALDWPEPLPDYVVIVNRAWERAPRARMLAFPAWLTSPLPTVAVPLREGEPEMRLSLQRMLDETYDGGPYARGAVDYTAPPPAELPDDLEPWRRERLAAWAQTGADSTA